MLQMVKRTEDGLIKAALVSISCYWRLVSIERREGYDNIMVQSYDMGLTSLLILLQEQGWEVIT